MRPVDDREPQTVPALVAAAAQRFGRSPALVDDGGEYDFVTLADEAARAAAAFAAHGLGRGDRVAIWASNSSEWAIAALGAACAGIVLVPINTRAKGEEAATLVRRARCRAVLTSRGILGIDHPDMLRASGVALDDVELVVLLRGEPAAHETSWSTFLARARTAKNGQAQVAALTQLARERKLEIPGLSDAS
jgi:acyl-CoA synthetase (AMP-forming)/AMP-acid ligase II